MLKTLAELPARFALASLAAVTVITAVSLYFLTYLELDTSTSGNFPPDDPATKFYERTLESFGSDELVILTVTADDIMSPAALARIGALTREVETIPGVRKVVGLTNTKTLVGSGDELEAPLLVDTYPADPRARAAWRACIADRAKSVYVNQLVSADLRAAALTVFFKKMSDDEMIRLGVMKRLDEAAERSKSPDFGPSGEKLPAPPPGYNVYFTGFPWAKEYMRLQMIADSERFIPASIAVVCLVLIVSFRSVRGLALPLVAVALSTVWTVGLMAGTGHKLSMVTVVLPPLLIAIASAYSIHVVSHYYELARRERDRNRLAALTARSSVLPVFVAAITTMAGFGSLIVNDISAISELGVFSVIGVFIGFLMAFVFVAPVLALLKPPSVAAGGGVAAESAPGTAFEKALAALAGFTRRRKKAIFVATAVLIAVSLAGLPRIVAETDLLEYFSHRSRIYRDAVATADNLAGTSIIYVVVEAKGGGPEDDFKDPANLKALDDLEAYVLALNDGRVEPELADQIDATLSVADTMKILNRALAGGDDSKYVIPASRKAVSENLFIYELGEGQAPSELVSPDLKTANVVVRTRLVGSRPMAVLARAIERYTSDPERFPTRLKATVTGTMVLIAATSDRLAWGQVKSLALALAVIFGVMSVLFLSLRMGFLAMVPNLLPIAVLFGIMGWFGVRLNIVTSLVACIALGIAVDDTIHYLTRFNIFLRETWDERESTRLALMTTGKPIVFTSVALFFGFGILIVSGFKLTAVFGAVTAVVMLICLAGDIVFLPALLNATRIVTLWDLLALKLGPATLRAVPLLRGMSKRQARILVLMGELADYADGEHIVRRGEAGDRLYVMIEGAARVLATGEDGGAREVARLETGDVFGEMAVVRETARSADVVADGPAQALALGKRHLKRLAWRYPWIALKLYRNLSSILSDRLQRTTTRYATVAGGQRPADDEETR